MAFHLWASRGHAEGHSQHKQNAHSDLLLDIHSLFAREEHGLHTDDFTSAAQNLNQASRKPASHPNAC